MKDSNVLISIIVPVFNMEDYIERCLHSLLNQTLKEIEIIVVNDGSTDKTLELLEEYAKNDSRIKIFSQSNCGVSLARKKGVKESQGEYTCFVDGDDWCEMNMCEDLYNTANQTKSDMIFFSAYRHREDGTAIIRNFPVDDGKYEIKEIYNDYILPLYGDLHTDKYITTGYACFCMFRSNLIKDMKFYEKINLHED
ncbi:MULTISPECIES: glycosyltransferase family 2 protein [unclassified Clostridium]|uniref:glycosyltransferase family 2 protein n=1 Tax=unclassified Clostridium TaxID=2614128 RepID=UPI002A810A90|nr:glycosyltransferase family 2 protein [Clostridium sp.]MCI6693162.1 glycosyltransferase [Clostridium sp.]MDY4252756.1 glycosyltransferase family 2 protein [Clostridium sp.]